MPEGLAALMCVCVMRAVGRGDLDVNQGPGGSRGSRGGDKRPADDSAKRFLIPECDTRHFGALSQFCILNADGSVAHVLRYLTRTFMSSNAYNVIS